jgi:hypothetical protein
VVLEGTVRKINLLATLLLLASVGMGHKRAPSPEGTAIKVRTDTAIPAHPPAGARYSASVSENVPDISGGIAIPRGSRATLVAEPTDNGNDTALDLTRLP